jgi:hypothetical protein
VREDLLLSVIDRCFHQHVFGPERLGHFHQQQTTLLAQAEDATHTQNEWLERQRADLDQRIELQLRSIEAGVGPTLVRERIEELKAERSNLAAAVREATSIAQDNLPLDQACEILDSLPDLTEALRAADPNSATACSTPSASPSRSTETRTKYR